MRVESVVVKEKKKKKDNMSKKILIFCALQVLLLSSWSAQAMEQEKKQTKKKKCPKVEKFLEKLEKALSTAFHSFNHRDPIAHTIMVKLGQKK